jgi:PAS domain S-box-containing protein
MRKSLRIIHLEDNSQDQELVQSLLERDGLVCEVQQVETRGSFEAALDRGECDLIISDFTLPSYDGMSALNLARQKRPEIPYLFVSGTLGEEQAIESLKSGATDYVLKHHLDRLVPAVRRALREADERTQRRKAEALQEAFFNLGQMLNSATTPEAAARIILNTAQKLLGWDAGSIELYSPAQDIVHPIMNMEMMLGRRVEVPDTRSHPPTPRMRQCLKDGGQLILSADPATLADRFIQSSVEPLVPSALMAPVRHGVKIIGVLSIEKYQAPNYGRGDLDTLSALADHCGGALERIAIEEEKSRLRARVQQQQNRIDNLLASVPGVVWETWTQADPVVQQRNFASHYVETLLGYTVEEWLALPKFWLAFVHPDDKQMVSEEIEKMVATRKGSTHQCRWIAKDGRVVWVETGANVICNQTGTVLGMRGVSIDITEKKKMEAQALRSHRLESIGTLASGIAHDLNNILSPILMGAQILLEKKPDSDSRELLDMIETYARRGGEVVKQVLTFARGAKCERVLFHPRRVLDEMARIAGETFPKSIAIETDFATDLWTILGEATQLHQVLLNLCVNARDAMPSGGTLTVSAGNILLDATANHRSPDAKAGPYVVIQVTDTGMGMPPDIIERIFDPFFSTKPHSQGTGLGLSTVLGIIKGHGGFVTVESQPCKGSRFEVYLPATPNANPNPPTPPTRLAAPFGGGELILVVDDEEGVRDLALYVLSSHGYEVLAAANGEEAANLVEQNSREVQLVLTDLTMPVMDGVSLARTLKLKKPQIRIIASSGFGEEKKLAELRALDVNTFLPKPYSAEQLLMVVHNELPGKTASRRPVLLNGNH